MGVIWSPCGGWLQSLMPSRWMVLLLTLSACSMPAAQYQLHDRQITCDDANRFAYKTLEAMGFTVTEFEAATYGAGGTLAGERLQRQGGNRTDRQKVAVEIQCSAAGATLNARDVDKWIDQVDFKRSFYMAFTSVISVTTADEEMQDRVARGTAPKSQQRHDLQVVVEPVVGHAAKLYFGVDLASARVLPVRVNVVNHTLRWYSLDPMEIRIRRSDRKRVEPLSAAAAAALVGQARDAETGQPITPLSEGAVAEKLKAELFHTKRLGPGAQGTGFLYFPLETYRGMRILFIDTETDEPEGVMVAF